MAKKVIILGGGVAGMSAAHELIDRGFEVVVYERKPDLPGGKARSLLVHDADAPGSNPLPGEHGFRFFPGFYKHVIDTMTRIPYPGNNNGVADNLVAAPHVMLAREGKAPIVMLDRFPKSFKDLKLLISSMKADTGLSHDDKEYFMMRIWQLITSCRPRRDNDYERMGWWEYIQPTPDERKDLKIDSAYDQLLATGLTRTLVAARATTASTKTGGDIFLQLIFNMANPSVPTDRILNGPTNDRWLFPWLKHLTTKGVKYCFDYEVTKIDCDTSSGSVTGVWTSFKGGTPEKSTADFYICAVPVEAAAPLIIADILNPGQTVHEFVTGLVQNADMHDPSVTITDTINNALQKAAIINSDPTLGGIIELSSDVQWMTGVQFYLTEVVELNKGHIIFSDSPWSVTAISQLQFWTDFNISVLADGKVKTILSCDVSEWDEPGLIQYDDGTGKMKGKKAKDCTAAEIKKDVWEQMKKSLLKEEVVDGKKVMKSMLSDDMIHMAFIDRDIIFEDRVATKNIEPLLVNEVDTWRLRPESHCKIPNLFFAGDYVRTHTDLATMEGANESARRAVNNVIEASGSKAPLCEIWDLHEPWIFHHLRKQDYKRYQKGLAWNEHFPWWIQLLQWILSLFRKGAKKTAG